MTPQPTVQNERDALALIASHLEDLTKHIANIDKNIGGILTELKLGAGKSHG